MKNLAPIALFVYARTEHTRKTLESLMQCEYADASELYIYCDGPKHDASESMLKQIYSTRGLLQENKWCKTIHIHEFTTNKGLPNILIPAVTRLVQEKGKIIVLEDDLVLGKGFLKYMNEALNLYESEERVMHISGYNYPSSFTLPETYFQQLSSGWGWGTWKRAWDQFNPSAHDLLRSITGVETAAAFDYDGHFPYRDMLLQCANGPWKFWDIRWYASIFVKKGLCLHPGKSLVRNIGHDNTGEHCVESALLSHQPVEDYVAVLPIPLEFEPEGKKAFIEFFLSQAPPLSWWRKGRKAVAKTFLPAPTFDKLIQWNRNRLAKPAFNVRTAPDWAKETEYLVSWGEKTVWNELAAFLSPFQGKVLDIGCGTGSCMRLLSRSQDLEIFGCDQSVDLIRYCAKQGLDPSRLNTCDARDLSRYDADSFDYTYSVHLLPYLAEEDIIPVIREIQRITHKRSFHFIPTSRSRKNEGWTGHAINYMNNTAEWWTVMLENYFPEVSVVNSTWEDGQTSVGKWMICMK